jgi:hypothetical protein
MPSWEYPTLEVPFKAYADLWSELLLYDDHPSANGKGLAQVSDHFEQISFVHAFLVLAGLTIIFVRGMADLTGYCWKGRATADWIFPLLAVLLLTTVPNLINGSETQRIRYSIEPMLYLALILAVSTRVAPRIKH